MVFWVTISNCATKQEKSITKVQLEEIKPVIIEQKSLIDEIRDKKEKRLFRDIIEVYEKRKNEFTNLELLKPVIISYLAEKRFEDILKIAEEKLNKVSNIDDKEISLILGIAYYEKGIFEPSRRVLSSLYESGFKNELVNIYLAMLYQKRNQYALALSLTGEIENSEKRNYLQGWILFTEGNYEKALEKFLSVKDFKDAQVYILYSLFYLNRHNEILKYFDEKKIDLNAKTIPIISFALINKGEIKMAKELLESIPESDRKSNFYRNLGLIYDIYFDEKEKAKEYYKKYLDEVKDDEVLTWIND